MVAGTVAVVAQQVVDLRFVLVAWPLGCGTGLVGQVEVDIPVPVLVVAGMLGG